MEYPHWNFGLAIAFNLCLTGFNLYLLWKLPHWRRKLWHLRQKFTTDERHIAEQLEQTRQQITVVPQVTNNLLKKQQRIKSYYRSLKLVIQLSGLFMAKKN